MQSSSVVSSLCLFVLCLVAGEAAAAPPTGDVVIVTRDGRAHLGRIVSETSTGFLLVASGGSEVIPFSDMVDVRALQSSAPASTAQRAPSSSAYAAPAEASPPSVQRPPPYMYPGPVESQHSVQRPPLPPSYASAASIDDAPPSVARAERLEPTVSADWLEQRRGFHVGVGAGIGFHPLGYLGTAAIALLRAPLDWNFGRVTFRLEPQLLVMSLNPQNFVMLGANAQAHFNLAEIFSLGLGYDQNLTFGAFTGYTGAISATPVRFNLGQHQLTLSVSVPFLTFGVQEYVTTLVGLVRPTLAYAYVF